MWLIVVIVLLIHLYRFTQYSNLGFSEISLQFNMHSTDKNLSAYWFIVERSWVLRVWLSKMHIGFWNKIFRWTPIESTTKCKHVFQFRWRYAHVQRIHVAQTSAQPNKIHPHNTPHTSNDSLNEHNGFIIPMRNCILYHDESKKEKQIELETQFTLFHLTESTLFISTKHIWFSSQMVVLRFVDLSILYINIERDRLESNM